MLKKLLEFTRLILGVLDEVTFIKAWAEEKGGGTIWWHAVVAMRTDKVSLELHFVYDGETISLFDAQASEITVIRKKSGSRRKVSRDHEHD